MAIGSGNRLDAGGVQATMLETGGGSGGMVDRPVNSRAEIA